MQGSSGQSTILDGTCLRSSLLCLRLHCLSDASMDIKVPVIGRAVVPRGPAPLRDYMYTQYRRYFVCSHAHSYYEECGPKGSRCRTQLCLRPIMCEKTLFCRVHRVRLRAGADAVVVADQILSHPVFVLHGLRAVCKPDKSVPGVQASALVAVGQIDGVLVGRTVLDGIQAVGAADLCTRAPIVSSSLDEQSAMSCVPRKGS